MGKGAPRWVEWVHVICMFLWTWPTAPSQRNHRKHFDHGVAHLCLINATVLPCVEEIYRMIRIDQGLTFASLAAEITARVQHVFRSSATLRRPCESKQRLATTKQRLAGSSRVWAPLVVGWGFQPGGPQVEPVSVSRLARRENLLGWFSGPDIIGQPTW